MILYKYVSCETGMKITETNTIGFSRPSDFNDPFELGASYPIDEGDNPLEQKLNDIRACANRDIWSRNTGILSLTRSPLNPLMWAHYCGEHTGFVIGLDMSQDIFTNENKNLVPVQYGSVIYTGCKPIDGFISKPKEALRVGDTHSFPVEHLNWLQVSASTKLPEIDEHESKEFEPQMTTLFGLKAQQ